MGGYCRKCGNAMCICYSIAKTLKKRKAHDELFEEMVEFMRDADAEGWRIVLHAFCPDGCCLACRAKALLTKIDAMKDVENE